MSHPSVSPHQDCIGFQEGGPLWPVVEIDLETHFRRLGIEVRKERLLQRSSGRACRSAWLVKGGRLWLTGVWGRVGTFHVPSDLPREAWIGEHVDEEEQRWLRSQGATRLKQRLFPGSNPITPIPADWVDQELVVLEGTPFRGTNGRRWDHYPSHRMITVRGGKVVRAWLRRNDPPLSNADGSNSSRDTEEH